MLWVLYRQTYFMGGFHRYLIGIRSVSDRYFIGIVSVWVVSLRFIGMSLVFNRYSIGVNHARVSCGACQGRQAGHESADRVDPSCPFLFPRKDWSAHFRYPRSCLRKIQHDRYLIGVVSVCYGY